MSGYMYPGRTEPLNIMQPSTLVVFGVFYSPIIISFCMLIASFVFQNFKGIIYLGFMLAMCVAREFLYKSAGGSEPIPTTPICNAINYSKHGNSSFTAFMLSFTFIYICFPMFLNDSVNWIIFGLFLSLLIADGGIRAFNNCITSISILMLNYVAGVLAGFGIIGLMVMGGSEKFLFFNEVQSNKVVCDRPKKQQFKCQVYKNGELVGSVMRN